MKTHEQYLKDLKAKGIHLIPLGKYVGHDVPIMHECTVCHSKREYVPSLLLFNKRCIVCEGRDVEYGYNSLWDTHPEVAKLLKDPEVGKTHSFRSIARADFVCPNCGTPAKDKVIRDIVQKGVKCRMCSDGVSYPMKFVMSLFTQLGVDYITEHRFDGWSFIFQGKPYRPIYDIVFDDYVVEVDGNIHYFGKIGTMTLEERKYVDKKKTELVRMNGFKMIRLDCRRSDLKYIKNSILSSELNSIFDLSNINWEQCHKDALTSRVKQVCDCWNNMEDPSSRKVAESLGFPFQSVIDWLKKGAEVGMCDYDPKKAWQKACEKNSETGCKKVICLNTRKVYSSELEASKENDCPRVSSACHGKNNTIGKDKVTGEGLVWMFYDDYVKLSEEEVQRIFHERLIDRLRGKIICVTTKQIFDTVTDVTKELHLTYQNVRKACNNSENHFYGVHPETKEPLSWMYYSDYLQMNGGDTNCA